MIGSLVEILLAMIRTVECVIPPSGEERQPHVTSILERLSQVTAGIAESAAALCHALTAHRCFPVPTPWADETNNSDPVGRLLLIQSGNIAILPQVVDGLRMLEGGVLARVPVSDWTRLVEAAVGTLPKISAALGMFVYPSEIQGARIKGLCTVYRGPVQLTAGQFLLQRVVSIDCLIRFIVDDYRTNEPGLTDVCRRVAVLYARALAGAES